ncbi:MAG: endo-1,4-beta-xylanase [Acidobacteria bacterium]|nr:MAG: endo-1,4-beta-xylanase [Acidobacteriota bacterium]
MSGFSRIFSSTVFTWLAVWSVVVASDRRDMPLRTLAADRFLIGAAINVPQAEGRDAVAMNLISRHFNTVTPENILKWEKVHPEPERYDFGPVDRLLEVTESQGILLIGHTLVWHQQTPRWVFKSASGEPMDRDALLERLRAHITAVVGRYKGRIGGWDVVNEAFEDDGTVRKTPWSQIIGEDFIAKAFEFAHQADPDAELYYNDYNLWKPAKRDAAARLVRQLLDRGVPVDGIGEQGHWLINDPPLDLIEAAIVPFGKLGVKVVITELDVDPLPRPRELMGADLSKRPELRQSLDPYREGLPDAVQQELAQRYGDIFRLFVKHADKIARVTFWAVTDANTWLNNFPFRGRTNHPMLWDREGKPKPAFDAVIKALSGK